mgnify:CR=1 FL=1
MPQALSYAGIAGLPEEFGLYASLVPVYAYAALGTSRQLGVVSLMLCFNIIVYGAYDAREVLERRNCGDYLLARTGSKLPMPILLIANECCSDTIVRFDRVLLLLCLCLQTLQ